jgi:hypothetical protein
MAESPLKGKVSIRSEGSLMTAGTPPSSLAPNLLVCLLRPEH